MSEPYYHELRISVVMLCVHGLTIRETAERFDVPIFMASRWRCEFVLVCRLKAKRIGEDPYSHRPRQHIERILAWVEEQPDITITEICERLAEKGCSLVRRILLAMLHREGCTRTKKTGHACEQARDDVKAVRRGWIQDQISPSRKLAGRNVIFIDKCIISRKMARSHEWSKRWKRCEASTPPGYWSNITLAAATSKQRIVASLMPDSPVDGHVVPFRIENMPIREPSKGDVAICDNLSVHKVAGIREALARVGVELLFLPPCGRDPNPIERDFSQIKSCLKKIVAKTQDDLEDATGKAPAPVTPQVACNYIEASGNRISPSDC